MTSFSVESEALAWHSWGLLCPLLRPTSAPLPVKSLFKGLFCGSQAETWRQPCHVRSPSIAWGASQQSL